MRQRVDYCYYWLNIGIMTLVLSLINATEQLISDDSQKELISKTQSKSTPENLNPLTGQITRVSKRASFMPSRGKKEDYDDFNVNMKKASGFLPMRGRKDYYQQQNNGWNLPNEYGIDSLNDNDKRAGFMPMRGRKSSDSDAFGTQGEDVYQSELDSVKRSSFMPMRGRKDDDRSQDFNIPANYGQDEYAVPQPYYPSLQIGRPNWMEGEHVTNENQGLQKKANAFFGARGKRSTYSNVGHVNNIGHDANNIGSGHQQTHNENFFATRG